MAITKKALSHPRVAKKSPRKLKTMEPRMSYLHRLLEDVKQHNFSSYYERAARLKVSKTWVEIVVRYLEERKQIKRTKAVDMQGPDRLSLTPKGIVALEAMDHLGRLLRR